MIAIADNRNYLIIVGSAAPDARDPPPALPMYARGA